jgi:hypothetical protein
MATEQSTLVPISTMPSSPAFESFLAETLYESHRSTVQASPHFDRANRNALADQLNTVCDRSLRSEASKQNLIGSRAF